MTDDGELVLDEIHEDRLPSHSLLQSWLHFGFLSDISGVDVRPETFSRVRPACGTEQEAVILNSTCLEDLVADWAKRLVYFRIKAYFLGFFHVAPKGWKTTLELVKQWQLYQSRCKTLSRTCMQVAHLRAQLPPPLSKTLLAIEVLCGTFVSGHFYSILYNITLVSRGLHRVF